MSQRSILIAANPRSGSTNRSDLVNALASKLRLRSFEVEIVHDLEQLRLLSHERNASSRLYGVVGAGGDGTASAVVSRIPDSIPFFPYPLGTENLLAKQFDIDANPDRAAATIETGKTKTLDAGLANDQLFLLMIGIGFDAFVVQDVHGNRKGHLNRWSYWFAIWRAIFGYRFPELRFQNIGDGNVPRVSIEEASTAAAVADCSDAEPTSLKMGNAKWLFVVNLPRYANGLSFAPWADGNDGKLDLCSFRQGGLWRSLPYVYSLFRGSHARLRDFETLQCEKLQIVSDEVVPYQIDGDAGGLLPLTVQVLPNRYRMIVP